MKSSARPHRRSASLDEGDLFASTSASASGGFVTAPILRHEPIERSPAPLASFLEQQQRQLYAEAPQPGDDALDESDDEASGSDDDDDEEGSSGESSSFDSDFMPTIATSARPRGGSLSAAPAQRARGMSGAFSYDDDDVADMNAREQELLVNIQELQRQLSMVQIQTEKPQEEIVPPTRDARRRLIMVSNRLPISFQRNETTGEWEFKMSSGGLVTALNGIRDEVPFIWIGWLGQEIAQEDQNKVREKLAKEFNCVPVFLSKEIASRYYNDFSNDILWPTFHYVPLPLFRAGSEKKFDFRLWDAYKLANKRFAQAVNQVYRDGDYVWIHDYHLMNLPTLLRKRHPKCKIGWFLHTPFPSSEMYRSLPVGKQILEGLLGADLLGFHTYDYARHFLSACGRIPGATSSPKGIEWEGHFSAVGVFPIGIDPEHFENILAKNETQQRIKELTEKFKGCKVIIGVDRMDYIKGIPHKLLAMERYLAKYPERRENVILVQIGVPSRTDVVEYQNLAASVNEMVGRINGRYGTLQHSPVHYIHRPIPPSELVALYNIADACLVTSLRDGMNLVSHEFVMCQSQPCAPHRDGPGVLVLSEFAGSAQSLSGAIRVNPWNTDDIATALEYAFTLPLMEREYRQSNLHRYVKTHTASFWGKSFLADLEYTTASRPPAARKLVKLPTMDVMTAYARSKRRMIVLDYEGTLLEEAHQRATPAPPKPFIKRIIESLASDKKNTVLLVSGHERGVIGSWLNDRRIGVVAESGYYYRLPYTDDWEMMTEDHDPSWKKVVRPIMQYFTERTPGSSIETKESSLTWHYGETDPIFGPMQARDMQVNLEDVLCSLPLEVQQGTNNVEVRLQGISKTVLIDEILKLYQQQQQTQQTQALPPVASGSGATGRKARSTPSPIDFVFCAGNGLEDDDIFTFFQEHHDQSKLQTTTPNSKTKTKTTDPTTTTTTNTNTSTNATGDTTSVSGTTTTSLLAGTSLPPGVARPPTPTRPPTPAPAPAPTPTVETRSPLKGSSALAKNANVYTCHIGANKTEAMYYLERPSDLVRVLRSLAAQSREGFAAHESPDVDLIGSSSPPVNSGESTAAPVSPP